ncbi:Oidioi.mRNA.OKI2018_I69.PAR.g8502.t2.cds [Oikopleura dioica]|uniref:Oidioi.mRNA.OKI2018_I69.PAR.g8502.t2.cds n=1 Tax=Oikopleura dioica TaxID=34765 RepID=A0ABN7RG92_OIKDI|nr:Oidioi.mRNA.OKI2018_I69.PAR.g8502.t2.cds [Oikopleura dioica]
MKFNAVIFAAALAAEIASAALYDSSFDSGSLFAPGFQILFLSKTTVKIPIRSITINLSPFQKYKFFNSKLVMEPLPQRQIAVCNTLYLNAGEEPLSKIYSGLYYKKYASEWIRDAFNKKGQEVPVVLRKARFKIGRSRVKHGWVLGYELNRSIRIRYFSEGSMNCPADLRQWMRVHDLRAYKSRSLRKKVINLGSFRPTPVKMLFDRD